MKKVLSLILAISLVFALAACGTGSDITMKQVISASNEALSAVTGTHVSLSAGTNVSSEELTDINTVGMECDIDLENNLYYATIDTTSNDETQIIDMYMRMGDVIDLYMSYDNQWIKMEDISKDILGSMGANSDVKSDFKFYYDTMLANENAVFATTEIEGAQHYSISAPIAISSIEDAKKFNIDSFLNALFSIGSDDSAVDEVLSAAAPLDVTLYINADTYLPYGFTIDFNKLLASVMDAQINQAYCAACYTDYNNVAITIPDEALDGMDLSALSQN